MADMNRRNVLLGLGTAAAGSGIVFGSGAFTQVTADRNVSIGVQGDPDANTFLQLEAGSPDPVIDNGGDGGNELEIDLEALTGSDGAFNVNSVVEIGDPNPGTTPPSVGSTDAFTLTNNAGTNVDLEVGLELDEASPPGTFNLVLDGSGEGAINLDANSDTRVDSGSEFDDFGEGESIEAAIQLDIDGTGSPSDFDGDIDFTVNTDETA